LKNEKDPTSIKPISKPVLTTYKNLTNPEKIYQTDTIIVLNLKLLPHPNS